MKIAVAVVLGLFAVALAVPLDPRPSKISEGLRAAFKTEKHVDVMIRMAVRANPMDLVSAVSLDTKAAKAAFVRESLLNVATSSQQEVVAILNQRNAIFKSFWITNSIFVEKADIAVLETLATRLDVDSIDLPRVEHIHKPVDIKLNVEAPNGNEWGVEKIKAPAVWAAGNKGKSAIVANIDTGVRWTHEALVGSYRGAATKNNGVATHDYNWFQPTGKSAAPLDNNGHGTHTMGTIAGTNGVGVAPEATWIACQGCATFGCSEHDLTTCAEFLVCPTDTKGNNPDCTKGADVINNSWGGGQGSDWYDSFIQAWVAADITPIFSIGNSGPRCGTANSPGDSPYTISVGATDINDTLAYFSSRGPSVLGDAIKPEVSAPGLNVRSAWHTSDTAYSSISGTSMASPHVTGTVALVMTVENKKNKKIAIAQIKKDLETTAETNLPPPTQGETSCGGISYKESPNYLYGFGRIDACAAVKEEGGSC